MSFTWVSAILGRQFLLSGESRETLNRKAARWMIDTCHPDLNLDAWNVGIVSRWRAPQAGQVSPETRTGIGSFVIARKH